MRALIVEPGPNFAVQDVYRGWLKGFSQVGLDIKGFEFSGRLSYHERALRDVSFPHMERPHAAARLASESLLATCFGWWPEVVFIVSAFFVPPEHYDLLRKRGIKVVVLLTEAPYEDPAQAPIAARADMAIVNDPTNLEMFRQHQPNTWYVPHAYDPDLHHRRPPSLDLAVDFGWVGTAYPSRWAFFEQVDWTGLEVLLGGNWQQLPDHSPLNEFLLNEKDLCLENSDAVELYSSCKASANIYRREAAADDFVEGWAMGPREVEMAACGLFYLTEERGENREVLPMLPTFSGPADFSEKLRWWLARDDLRDEVAAKAQAAIADRTFTNNARFVMERLTAIRRAV